MYKVYGNKYSGNSYKIKLLCSLLDIDYEWHEIDIFQQQNCSTDFLKLNPLGQVPILVIEQDLDTDKFDENNKILSESNAILYYLAQQSFLIPKDDFQQAKMWQWLLYEQAEVRNNLASIRFIKKFQNMIPGRLEEYNQKFIKSQNILSFLDVTLADKAFILGNQLSIADISLYAYTHAIEDGGIALSNYPHLQNWIKRIKAVKGYVAIAN